MSINRLPPSGIDKRRFSVVAILKEETKTEDGQIMRPVECSILRMRDTHQALEEQLGNVLHIEWGQNMTTAKKIVREVTGFYPHASRNDLCHAIRGAIARLLEEKPSE